MTVSQLIETLKEYPPHLHVVTDYQSEFVEFDVVKKRGLYRRTDPSFVVGAYATRREKGTDPAKPCIVLTF